MVLPLFVVDSTVLLEFPDLNVHVCRILNYYLNSYQGRSLGFVGYHFLCSVKSRSLQYKLEYSYVHIHIMTASHPMDTLSVP